MTKETLFYRDSEGNMQELAGCKVTQDKVGRYWIWSEALGHNLAYKAPTKEDALLASIRSLLFTIELKNKEIAELREVYNLAMKLADRIWLDCED